METENKFTFKPPKGWSRETGTPEEIAFMNERKAKAEATREANKALGITTTTTKTTTAKANSNFSEEEFLSLIFKSEALPVIKPLLNSSLNKDWFKLTKDYFSGISINDKTKIFKFNQILATIESYQNLIKEEVKETPVSTYTTGTTLPPETE